MISEQSIEEVKEKADLLEVCQSYVTLKKKGANHVGCCPFHKEETASFAVSPAKGIYKCFGCGASGTNPINFVMKLENMNFVDAVKLLANRYNVQLEETEPDPEQAAKAITVSEYQRINTQVAELYQKNLLAIQDENNPVREELIKNRQLTEDTIITFQIGFAPNEWKFITPTLIQKGLFNPASDIGLIATSNGNTYDMFRNRIMFPIHNMMGAICGFGGRKMEDNNKDNPKYLNSKDSLVYKKENILYGLYQAIKAIREMGFANLVEGYYDVISFHQKGMANTVAPCGTALTEGHAKLLKKFTDHVILIGDGDAAGRRANLKGVDILLRHNFRVDICDLPDKHDPDSFAREMQYEEDEAA